MDADTKGADAGVAIEQAGMNTNTRVILFDGLDVDVFAPRRDAFEPKRFATALYNIQRWNGHLRIPGVFSLGVARTLDDGDGLNYAFYSDLAHSILVALCLQRTMEDGVARRRMVRQALMHEASEVIIGDMVGPFKRQIKERVKPFERRIDATAFGVIRELINEGTDLPPLHPADLHVAEGEEGYLLKQADIMAQDIEAWVGQRAHIRGVNISQDFSEKRWMIPALIYAINSSPDDYIQALRYGDVLAPREQAAGRGSGKESGSWMTSEEFMDYADIAGISYDDGDIPLWRAWFMVMLRSSDHIRERLMAKAKGDRKALASGLIIGDGDD